MDLAIRTRWTLVCDEQNELCALENQYILIQDGQIKGVSSDVPRAAKVIDYGFSIALPGLINVHCHLDYSSLSCLDLFAKTSEKVDLFRWIPVMIEATAHWSEKDYFASACQGAEMAAICGTSFLVDNSFSAHASLQALSDVGLKGLVGLELFGIDESQAQSQFASWQERFCKLQTKEGIQSAVSPHAPYTVSPKLWKMAQDFARTRNTRVLAHLSESQIEYDWFKKKENNFDSALDRFLLQAFSRFRKQDAEVEQLKKLIGSLPYRHSGLSPVEHLQSKGLLDERLLAAHCVWIDDNDIDLLKSHSSSIALCPVSNDLLKNGEPQVEKFIASGLKLGLGTDSLASAHSLDLRQVARFTLQNLRKRGINADSRSMLSLLTVKAASALGQEKQIGSLAGGKSADILVLKLPLHWNKVSELKRLSPFDMALSAQAKVEDLFVNGKKVVSNGKLAK